MYIVTYPRLPPPLTFVFQTLIKLHVWTHSLCIEFRTSSYRFIEYYWGSICDVQATTWPGFFGVQVPILVEISIFFSYVKTHDNKYTSVQNTARDTAAQLSASERVECRVDTWPPRHARLIPVDPAQNDQNERCWPRIQTPQCVPNTCRMHYEEQNNTTQSNKWSPFQRRKVLILKSKIWDGGVKLSGPQSTLPAGPTLA